MLAKKLWLPALVAFSMSVPAVVRAQDMGGGMGGDEKKDDGDKPAEPKGDAPKPAEPAKPEPPKEQKKTLGFDAPASFKDVTRGGGRGPMKHVFTVEPAEGEQKAAIIVRVVGSSDYDKEKAFWIGHFEDKDGKKLDKSAVKEDAFEANGVKGKVAEFAGNFAARPPRRKKGGDEGVDSKPPEKKWTKVIAVFLEGPDGNWVVRIQGGEKTVEKYRDDFMKYVKSVKLVDKTDDDKPAKKSRKKKDDDD